VRLKPNHAFGPFELLIKKRIASYSDKVPGAGFSALSQKTQKRSAGLGACDASSSIKSSFGLAPA
jgi:hypothetical protein